MIKIITNRVFLGAAVVLIGLWMWQNHWRPQYRGFYEAGVAQYKHGDYAAARKNLETAYKIEPNSTDVIAMMGWNNLKLHAYDEAARYFDRLSKINPKDEQAILGNAALAIQTGRGSVDIAAVEALARKHPDNPDIPAILASAYVQQGENTKAANIYRRLLSDSQYKQEAQLALSDLYGLNGFDDPVPAAGTSVVRAASLQSPFRAADFSMWRPGPKGESQKYYVAGVDLGPGAPGYFPGAPPDDGRIYTRWLSEIARMNANVVRVYTLLPPDFYRAFQHQVDAGSALLLYQQVWVGDPPNKNLFDPQFVNQTRNEIRYVVDAIHGNGDVPRKNARGSGLFVNDIASHVGAILLGREIEPSTAITTNQQNPQQTAYSGKYISITGANATETWFAMMLDYLVRYETETYNWQHPVAVVNWPPLDHLTHPTETPLEEELKIRAARGEKLAPISGPQDDNDTVAIDESKFKVEPDFRAGLFASYHVYPYYPDFLLNDPQYSRVKDAQGPNPMYGYLRDLRARLPYPLVISEYGIPNSIGISHMHPFGMNHGGHSELEQAELLTRMTRSIRAAGCAGGIVFEWLDEWYKQNWLNRDFEAPLERTELWLNELDPEKRYGLVGFRPGNWKLFADGSTAWSQEPVLVSVGEMNDKPGISLQAASDEAYLYLRISGVEPQDAYAVALNTLPGRAGVKQLPFGASVAGGANFLLLFDSSRARLLIDKNYNPYSTVSDPIFPNETDIFYRRNHTAALADSGSFGEMIVETNRRRYLRDGRVVPPLRYDRSELRKINGVGAYDDNSLGEWYYDTDKAVILRIAWGKLYVTDPSSHTVFSGFDSHLGVLTAVTPGIDLTLLRLGKGARDGKPSLPDQVSASTTGRYSWENWDRLKPEMYFKKSYFAMQKEFHAQTGAPAVAVRGLRFHGAADGRAAGR